MGGRAELTADPPRAELVADRGEAAQTADFFRSRAFYDAEGVTHTLRIQDAAAIDRASPASPRDPRHRAARMRPRHTDTPAPRCTGEAGSPPDPAGIDWSSAGLVSVFARERLGEEPCLAGQRARSVVQVHDPARPREHCARASASRSAATASSATGSRCWRGPRDLGRGARELPRRLHRDDAAAPKAAERYFFDPDYLATILGFERSWLVLGRSPEGATAAGAIAALSDGLLHYYLGGTAEAHLGDSPFKNVVEAMIELAGELGVPSTSAAGSRPATAWRTSSAASPTRELPFHTHEIVCDPGAYERLSEGRADSGFFPLYRASAP